MDDRGTGGSIISLDLVEIDLEDVDYVHLAQDSGSVAGTR